MKSFEYFKPESLKEASELLIKYGENAHILNGGTDLVVRMRENLTTPEVVVDIKGIKELYDLNYDEKEGLFVGACVKLSDMAHNKAVVENYSFLADSAETVGSGQVRNLATMAGNNCNASPLADTSTPLVATDAVVHIYGPNGERKVSIHEFFKGVRKTCLAHGEIVTGIQIPANKDLKGVFIKNSRRKEVDLSTVCTTVVKIGDEIKIAMGAVAPTPIRAWEAEKLAKGKELTDELISQVADMAASEAKPIDDVRASKEYRKEMVRVMVRRSLEQLRG
ncbi:carbon-monoxide dehydrogenase medium subunit [Proteiniborus ethanoligenes]|uniref:Carbon-monoxide dehydrogenase medium subunit n=1 Tax=Proteiniborus ethanoligenes TaxID=415015 RepID=A0A1H3MKE6_9FIRM|nr:xanthine dehydrogenase family protein subunit M [Proteiniborus ethanoligenes]SDY77063.1 carbon-monoxide dehydrogenase medium subunit [Proteiniborus ethanoligenes]